MDNDQIRSDFAARLTECLRDSGIERHKWASTLAIWLGKSPKNPMFARKWLAGDSMPIKANLRILAQQLAVREEWLEYGIGAKEALPGEKQALINEVTSLLSSMSKDDIDQAINVLKVLTKFSQQDNQ